MLFIVTSKLSFCNTPVTTPALHWSPALVPPKHPQRKEVRRGSGHSKRRGGAHGHSYHTTSLPPSPSHYHNSMARTPCLLCMRCVMSCLLCMQVRHHTAHVTENTFTEHPPYLAFLILLVFLISTVHVRLT